MKCDDFLEMVMTEYKGAKEKHPVFADQFTDFAIVTFAKNYEDLLKSLNSRPPYRATLILKEEIAEATTAYLEKDKARCLQELAQCAAVIFRMADFVEEAL